MAQSLYDEALDELRRRRVAFTETFIPYYLCSFGSHLFNLHNKQARVYHEHGSVPDLRLHMMMVAPPGFSKSFFIRQLLHMEYGILSGGPTKTDFESYVTQAGFVGTITKDKGVIMETKGLIEEMSDGIVGMEEFSALTAAMNQQHSLGLDSAVLEALDSGRVKKRMAAGTKNIQTNITLWAGTQEARFDLTSGLGRRFFYLVWVPTRSERVKLKDARKEGRQIEVDPTALKELRQHAIDLQARVGKIKQIELCGDLDEFMKTRVHYEDLLFEKLAIGYQVMREQFDSTLQVTLDTPLKILMTRALQWRDRLLAESEGDQVIQVIEDYGGGIEWAQLRKELLVFGLNYSDSEFLIQRMIQSRLIEYKAGKLWLPGRFVDTKKVA